MVESFHEAQKRLSKDGIRLITDGGTMHRIDYGSVNLGYRLVEGFRGMGGLPNAEASMRNEIKLNPPSPEVHADSIGFRDAPLIGYFCPR